ncbi:MULTISPECIES: EutN/CcmL family microcompartment protein [Brevibacillus]|jgi:ethanolamine utilization protein EutN|uniref:Ethanolamine utilization protein EutN n=2 Tax=Brevibacillus TaxID=55080 RepID=A0A1I3V178_9BACL|nr:MULTISPECIES: EutN/CcmL family microcompartment protein [Brevibacillus]MEC2127441.1 EutN/CcmL family microcompartment protein [Brevibacillus centrosporus]MED1952144.1 EutN/CcmL family microcompartment protein [Brevibacillus centrosporus]MED4907326.1 EutN/CcmL family microcompartment protein [Brevibacillus centrosporus]RNB67928.1 ethanolamine utilization protein EutN [Brevibacillus centrosporus]RNB79466.1 ethanolamine utilization protein EutN [Brevibacillus nitrificans]
MFLGKVIGSVWATQKEAGMENLKLMVVQPIDWRGTDAGQTVIAADRIGAGIGEQVIVSRGTPARILFSNQNVPIDAVIVGIVDSYEVPGASGGAD